MEAITVLVLGSVNNSYINLLIYLNFHPFEVVSRYRDPQLQVGKNSHMCLI